VLQLTKNQPSSDIHLNPVNLNTESIEVLSQAEDGDLTDKAFIFNPLGFLQFGPIFQFEFALMNYMYIVPHFRYAYAGLLTHVAWDTFDEDAELSAGSFGIGAGLKIFNELGSGYLYYGGILDLAFTKARYDIGFASESEEKATELSLMGNVGYRWITGGGFSLNLGLIIGPTFSLSAEETFIGGGPKVNTKETSFLAMLEFSLGWAL